jgi:hypothetical protein
MIIIIYDHDADEHDDGYYGDDNNSNDNENDDDGDPTYSEDASHNSCFWNNSYSERKLKIGSDDDGYDDNVMICPS